MQALVTGATSGMGLEYCRQLAQRGHNLVMVSNQQEQLDTLPSLISRQYNVRAIGRYQDLAAPEAAQQLYDWCCREGLQIDILVNNAGITKDTALKRMTEEQWDAVINVNLKSVFNFTKAVQPVMWKQAGGSVINMSSVVGVSGNANQCNYSASKAGIIGFTKSAAKEMGVRNIRHNAIAPGFIITAMTNALPEDVRKAWESLIPLRRGGTPEDVANVALFLASDLSSYVTGQVIHCCGGMNC